jgi:hypothetical protein
MDIRRSLSAFDIGQTVPPASSRLARAGTPSIYYRPPNVTTPFHTKSPPVRPTFGIRRKVFDSLNLGISVPNHPQVPRQHSCSRLKAHNVFSNPEVFSKSNRDLPNYPAFLPWLGSSHGSHVTSIFLSHSRCFPIHRSRFPIAIISGIQHAR